MQTRSQTKATAQLYQQRIQEAKPLPIKNVILPIKKENLPVDIDFDEASRAWYANKKRMPNAMCKYICMAQTKTGKPCCRRPLQWENYCCIHK